MICFRFLGAGSDAAVRTGGTRRVSHTDDHNRDNDHDELCAGKLNPLLACSPLQTSHSLLPKARNPPYGRLHSAMFDDGAEDSLAMSAVSSSATTIAADTSKLGHDRVTSIDMALELERQLHSEQDDDDAGNASSVNQPGLLNVDTSPDPLILAGIITNLRHELAEVVAERDSLSKTASDAKQRDSELRDALAMVTGKASAMEDELTVLKLKNTADEETIAVLRSKVDESR